MKNFIIALGVSLLFIQKSFAIEVVGVLSNKNNHYISKAEVSIVGTDKKTYSDVEGSFSLEFNGSLPIELHIQALGYNHKNIFIEQTANTLKLVLDKSIIEHVDVIGLPIHASTLESAIPVNVVAGEALRDKQASTLGETLKAELGVHSTYFGPVASSPIIRGLDGPRVLITQNSLDVGDASRVGPDHIVASETSTAQQIEVLRGPATLFYGSGAIGGVVNIVDNRVPTSNETRGDWQVSHNSVAQENAGAFNINTGSENFAYHFDAFSRASKDYQIPAPAELEVHDDEHDDEHEAQSSNYKLANSAAKSSGFTLGSSYLFDQGFVGFSYGELNRQYGIPGHSHDEEEHDEAEHEGEEEHEGEADVSGDLKQSRWQLLSEINLKDSWLTSIATKVGYSDYRHFEIEDQQISTRFNNQSLQTKVDLVLADISGWRGALTFDYKNTDFEAIGAEAFTPSNTTESFATAFIEEKHFGDLLIQVGARVEKVKISAQDTELALGSHDEHDEADHDAEDEHQLVDFNELSYTPVSVSLGAVWDFYDGYNLGLSLSHAQRAPSAAELFSFGPHIGTNTYEVGAYFQLHNEEMASGASEETQPHFDIADNGYQPTVETSNNLDLTVRKFEGDFGFIVSGFYNQIDDFYYQENTGYFFADEHDHEADEHEADEHEEAGETGLPIYIYQQADAEFIGLEVQLLWQLNNNYKMTLLADTITGKLKTGEHLPRIPPSRLGLITNSEFNQWRSELSIMHYFKQSDVAALETATAAYTLVDFSAHYYFSVADKDMAFYLKANNLTDEAARVHTSFIKNQTLLPGRGITLGIRGDF
ncbi:MAG: TonB-dependent receptor [Thalassotalea sp.]